MNLIQATSVWNLIQRVLPLMVEEGVYCFTHQVWCWSRSHRELDYFEYVTELTLDDGRPSRLLYARVRNKVLIVRGGRPVALVSAFPLDRFVMDLESGHTFRMERT